MNVKEMDRFTAHLDHYFEQENELVYHSLVMDPHIDLLIYEPTKKYPFWKLATMGASDYRMSGKMPLGNRNEYLMFVDEKEDLNKEEVLCWYYNQLMEIAAYPVFTKTSITYGHSLEWEPEEGEEMTGAFLELPQVINDSGIVLCKLGLLKTVTCLQAVLLNRGEIDRLMEIGPEEFSSYLYPDEGKGHFLSERIRSDRF